uniref:Uncharacterized protein n=1 Tax=Arundo donax TaxID=35708 RepID=A0A0A9BZA1_ARUDO
MQVTRSLTATSLVNFVSLEIS